MESFFGHLLSKNYVSFPQINQAITTYMYFLILHLSVAVLAVKVSRSINNFPQVITHDNTNDFVKPSREHFLNQRVTSKKG